MKSKEGILLLLASLLVVSSALAQTEDSQATTDSPNDLPHQVAIARCAYSQTDDICANVHQPSSVATDVNGDSTLAQVPRRPLGPPMHARRPPMGRRR